MWWLQRTREKLRGTTRGPYSNGDLKRPHPFLLVVNLKWILQIQNRLPPTFSAGWTGHHRSICKNQNHHFTFSSFYISKFFKLFIYFFNHSLSLSFMLFSKSWRTNHGEVNWILLKEGPTVCQLGYQWHTGDVGPTCVSVIQYLSWYCKAFKNRSCNLLRSRHVANMQILRCTISCSKSITAELLPLRNHHHRSSGNVGPSFIACATCWP